MKIPNLASRNQSGARYLPSESQSAANGPRDAASFMRFSCSCTASAGGCCARSGDAADVAIAQATTSTRETLTRKREVFAGKVMAVPQGSEQSRDNGPI